MAYLVMEYIPSGGMTRLGETVSVRLDGHYSELEDARRVGALWAENPLHAKSRIAVVSVVEDVKRPAHWPKNPVA